jgi:WD40 repeat protein
MSAKDTGLADEDFTAWAVAFDESLAASNLAAPPLAGPADPELRQRQEQFRSCLQRLEKDRRACSDSAAGTAPSDPKGGPPALPVPRELGRFRLQRVLGRGGFGVVYLAEDVRLCRRVALKIPRPETLFTPGLRQRFLREAQATARLSHPHILPVFEPGEVGPFCFLVEAYCSGGSLANWLAQRTTPLSARAAALLLSALAGAVQHAHEHGVLHRDLKPANILLEPLDEGEQGLWDGFRFRPRVGDFGLAKFLDLMEEESSSSTEGAAGAGPPLNTVALLGTPAYMAPEQAGNRRAEIGVATDVYALGALLYELLTGRPPIQGTDPREILRRVESEDPVRLRQLRPDVPRDLEAICHQCLAKAPACRYVSVQALAEDVRHFLASEPVSARPTGIVERAWKGFRRHPAVAALSGVAAAALLCLIAWATWYAVHLRENNIVLQDALRRAETGERLLREVNHAIEMTLAGTMVGNDPSGLLGELINGLRPAVGQEDLRSFAWYHLWNIAKRDLRLRGHTSEVAAVAISPDGAMCASGGYDGALHLWDLRTGTSLAAWRGHNLQVGCVAFTADGRNLVTASYELGGEVIVWDVATRARVAHLKNEVEVGKCRLLDAASDAARLETAAKGRKYRVAVATNDSLVAFAELVSGRVGVWNWRTGKILQLLQEDPRVVVSTMQLSADAGTLAVAFSHPYSLVCWDLRTGKNRTLEAAPEKAITTLAFSPDGSTLVSGSLAGSLQVWDLARGQLLAHRQLNDLLRRVGFSPDGKLLAIATDSRTSHAESVTLWNMPACERRPEVLKPGFSISDLVFAPDGRTVAVACADRHVHLWQPFAEDAVSMLNVSGQKEAWSVAFAPDSQTLAVGYDDEPGHDRETLKLWDVRTGAELANLGGHQAMVSETVFGEGGRLLASAGYDNVVKLWDTRTRRLRATLTGHTAPLTCLAVSPDSRLLASGGRDKTVKLWDLKTGKERFTFPGRTQLFRRVAFARDSHLIAAADEEGAVRFWDTRTGQSLGVLQDWTKVMALAYAPDGDALATGNGDGAVRVWDPADGHPPRDLLGHRGEVRAVAYSPDGKTLASGGDDRTVRLWQVTTGRELLVFKDLPHKVNSLAFSPDGRHLAAALHDGSVRLWHAAAEGE